MALDKKWAYLLLEDPKQNKKWTSYSVPNNRVLISSCLSRSCSNLLAWDCSSFIFIKTCILSALYLCFFLVFLSISNSLFRLKTQYYIPGYRSVSTLMTIWIVHLAVDLILSRVDFYYCSSEPDHLRSTLF